MNSPLISQENSEEQASAQALEKDIVQPQIEAGSSHTRPLADLEEVLGYAFENKEYLKNALVHKSYLHDVPDFYLGSNERLEFLGDAVLGLIVSAELFVAGPGLSEGELTALRGA